MSKTRLLIVDDGSDWFVRQVRLIEHDLTRDEKVYRCDKHIGGPFDTLDDAVRLAKATLAGCTCRAGSPIQSSMHARTCTLRFDRAK
jgi:hypothetical protein